MHSQTVTFTYSPDRARDLLENVPLWLENFLRAQAYVVGPSGHFASGSRKLATSRVLSEAVLQYVVERNIANRHFDPRDRVQSVPKGLIEDAVHIVVEREWRLHLEKIGSHLGYSSVLEDSAEVKNFVDACVAQPSQVELNVLRHWMWQVKRKLIGKPVTNHLMIVFTGKQGAGKSTAIDILMKPLEAYRLDMAVPALADERNYHSLSRSFVVVCDEMHGCAKADIESLKHIVTARSISARKLFTNSRDILEQSASFIGSSNKPVELLVRDDSGMRRFFSMDCAEKMNWELLNAVSAENMWRSVDENRDEGYLSGVLEELRGRQEEMRHRDSVESYLDETGALTGKPQKIVSVRDVFSDYVDWCKESAATPFDKTYFSKRVRALGIERLRTSQERRFVLGEGYVRSRDSKVFDLAEMQPAQ
jgi:hypothetical protein